MSQAAAAAPETVPAANERSPTSASPIQNCRAFCLLIATQFQGIFNENGLKNLVVFIMLATVAHRVSRDRLVLIVGTLFSPLFILFSMTGRFLAHPKYSRRLMKPVLR